ncbi:MAG: YigZ family protein [Clostridia bacterium]|nr:YigZ family protein [Clostridia bacterium]
MDYLTLKAAADAEYTVNRSRFIAHASPVESAEEANVFIQEIRRQYPDATHNVFAFQVRQPEYARYSDDGEPSGTSGMPVLQVLKGRGLTDSIIVVTRYFGGILLGTGGLVRAYTQSAVLGVEAAGIVCMRQCAAMVCPCPYAFYERFGRLLEKHGYHPIKFKDWIKIGAFVGVVSGIVAWLMLLFMPAPKPASAQTDAPPAQVEKASS